MFKNPFSFEGRIRRTEYGVTIIIYMIVVGVLELIMINGGAALMAGVGFIPLLWFMWAQGAKRCHDRGNSGWFQLIPFYGFWMLFADSDQGENEYGANPKEVVVA